MQRKKKFCIIYHHCLVKDIRTGQYYTDCNRFIYKGYLMCSVYMWSFMYIHCLFVLYLLQEKQEKELKTRPHQRSEAETGKHYRTRQYVVSAPYLICCVTCVSVSFLKENCSGCCVVTKGPDHSIVRHKKRWMICMEKPCQQQTFNLVCASQ